VADILSVVADPMDLSRDIYSSSKSIMWRLFQNAHPRLFGYIIVLDNSTIREAVAA